MGSLCLQKRSGFTQFTFDSCTMQFSLKSSSEGQMGLCGGWACFTCKKDRIHLDYLWLSLALQFLLRIRSERWMCQKGGWACFAYKIGLDPPSLRSRRIWGVGGLALLTKNNLIQLFYIWLSCFMQVSLKSISEGQMDPRGGWACFTRKKNWIHLV